MPFNDRLHDVERPFDRAASSRPIFTATLCTCRDVDHTSGYTLSGIGRVILRQLDSLRTVPEIGRRPRERLLP